MDRKLRSVSGQAIYALRKTVVEPVFGQIKGGGTAGSLPVARAGAGERGMGADGHHPQHPQAVQGVSGIGLRSRLGSLRLQSGRPRPGFQEINHSCRLPGLGATCDTLLGVVSHQVRQRSSSASRC